MTPEEIEDAAYQGGPMPDLRSMAEVMLFHSFRSLYDFARRNQMPPEQGRREKKQILDTYKVYRFWEGIQEDTIQLWKDLEIAASTYRKERCLENADHVLEVIYKTKILDRKEP